jgi:hypothetical protein
LLGVVGFLCCERRGRYGWAGAVAVLAAVKPHLVYLFAAALLLWALRERRWRLLAGGLFALLALTAVPLACNPHVIEQFRYALGAYPPQFLSPTLGDILRLWFGKDKLWLRSIPVALGLAWFVAHWLRHRRHWSWAEQTPVLLLASFLTSSYGVWQFDLVVLLVPVLRAAAWVAGTRRSVGFAVTLLAGFNVMALLLMDVRYTDQYLHVWMTPMLLYGSWSLRRESVREPAETPIGRPEPAGCPS